MRQPRLQKPPPPHRTRPRTELREPEPAGARLQPQVVPDAEGLDVEAQGGELLVRELPEPLERPQVPAGLADAVFSP